MYPIEWVERLKWTVRSRGTSATMPISAVSPVVWSLGLVSLLTDVSTEMVGSVLPVYLVLHLHLSPLQFAAIDGIYNGLSVALVAVLSGVVADRAARHKQVAAFGYSLSAVCKLGLLMAGSAWGMIMGSVGIDRLGKGIRTAPRDSIISLHTPPPLLGTAFGVHRALDATGALLGPLVAFALLAQIPGAFDLLWIISFIVGSLGVAALILFVPSQQPITAVREVADRAVRAAQLVTRRFVGLASCGTALALLTVSDGFLYLLLQQKSQTAAGFVPLFYVGTAAAYMLFAVPAGLLADRYGRTRVFGAGYAALAIVYSLLFFTADIGVTFVVGALVLLGIYYAATEGVLMALASSIVSPTARTTGLALVATSVGLGKLASSLAFGWMWQMFGAQIAIAAFAVGTLLGLAVVVPKLRALEHG